MSSSSSLSIASSSTNCSSSNSKYALNPPRPNSNIINNNNNNFPQQQYTAGWMDTLWAPPQQQQPAEQHSAAELHSLCNNNSTSAAVDYQTCCDSSSYGSPYRNHQQQQQQCELTVLSSTNDCYEAIAVPRSSIDEDLATDYTVTAAATGIGCADQQLSPPLKLARPGPIGRTAQCQQTQARHQIRKVQQSMALEMPVEFGGCSLSTVAAELQQRQPMPPHNNGNTYEIPPAQCQQLVILRQPEEQHRARYASEGSRGAIKDRSGSSFCTIQLLGHYRPTRVELFAAQRTGANAFVEHNLYRLVPVSGKSSTEVMLRPENGMVVVLDCVGIMKICAYVTTNNKQQDNNTNGSSVNCSKKSSSTTANCRHKRRTKAARGVNAAEQRTANSCGTTTIQQQHEQLQQEQSVTAQQRGSQNDVHIVAQVQLSTDRGRMLLLQTHTEAIRCVQQLGCPDVLKMSLYEANSGGGQQLFIVGRNFNPKNLRVLFREYNNDGALAWSAEAKLDQRLVHQCHIVCTVPTYHNLHRGALVSVTVICGPKQSHPINFTYTACGRDSDDDDWRPPDCTNVASTVLNGYGNYIASSNYGGFGAFNQHIAYGSQNLRQKFSTANSNCAADDGLHNDGNF